MILAHQSKVIADNISLHITLVETSRSENLAVIFFGSTEYHDGAYIERQIPSMVVKLAIVIAIAIAIAMHCWLDW